MAQTNMLMGQCVAILDHISAAPPPPLPLTNHGWVWSVVRWWLSKPNSTCQQNGQSPLPHLSPSWLQTTPRTKITDGCSGVWSGGKEAGSQLPSAHEVTLVVLPGHLGDETLHVALGDEGHNTSSPPSPPRCAWLSCGA